MKFTVIGRVYPENAAVWMKRIESPTSHGGRYSIECKQSQLCLTFESATETDVDTVKITTENLAQTYISAIGFALGAGYTVEITQVIAEDGTTHFYGPKQEALAFTNDPTVLEDSWTLAGRDPFFRFAVIDYCQALVNAVECGAFCFRAIEAIKCAFDNKWDTMHASLGTTRDQIDTMVKVNADSIRHGNWSEIPDTTNTDRLAACRLTRDILHKYLRHRIPPRTDQPQTRNI